MSHNVTMTSHDTSSSGYRTHEDLHDSKKIVTLEDREKLKEELLRQYEAGQLKPRVILSGSSNTPRQIPTIEEFRAAVSSTSAVCVRPRVAISVPRHVPSLHLDSRHVSSLHLPDVSRPPPGYSYPAQRTLYQSHLLTPAPSLNYEDKIVNRVLQTIISGSQPPAPAAVVPDLDLQQTPGVVDKVLNWDTSGHHESRRPSRGQMFVSSPRSGSRSFSRDGRGGPVRSRRRLTRSRSPSAYSARHDHYLPRRRSVSRSPARRPRRRSGSRCRGGRPTTPPRPSYRSPTPCVSRHQHQVVTRRDISPRTRTYNYGARLDHSPAPPRHRRPGLAPHRSPRSRPAGPPPDSRRPLLDRRSPKKRRHVDKSPRSRKIILLSPQREGRSIREKINEERDSRHSVVKATSRSGSPVKKRVKDRLGVKKEPTTEVFNMDSNLGRCGAVAIVKEYIDENNGLMELRTTEGGHGSVILFNENQVWIADRKNDPNGPPILFVSQQMDVSLARLMPVGQEVLVNCRKVRSELVSLQATLVWPRYTETPACSLQADKLDSSLATFHQQCRLDKLVPVCINGLPPVGSLNIWSARVRELVNSDFGVVEVTSDPRDGKREFSHKFKCFFHKSDLWLEDGVCVGENEFYSKKPLSELVSLQQPVDLVARSIIREKGQFMKKSTTSILEMQALSVSLKTFCIPKGAPRGSRIGGGPGAFGGCNRGETPYMFQVGLKAKLNTRLNIFLQLYGKNCMNLDPELVDKCPPVSHPEVSKKVYKITDHSEEMDKENNNVRSKSHLAETVSNVQAFVKEVPGSDGFGLLQSSGRDWNCLFHLSDCVLFGGQEELRVGTKVWVNANLVDAKSKVQYIASSVWGKSERSLILPNITRTEMISTEKIEKYNNLNQTYETAEKLRMEKELPAQKQMESGVILKILDENFGIISKNGQFVLFDTCDFWIEEDRTAARSEIKLEDLVSVGSPVFFHAALVNAESRIPYLATAVWKQEQSPFPDDQCPVVLRQDQIHPDKIKIYNTVTSCSSVLDGIDAAKEQDLLKCKLNNVFGIVKVGLKFHKAASCSAGIVKLSSEGDINVIFLSSVCLESHEVHQVCVPGTPVTFSALPVSTDYAPVTHVATVISSLHSDMPLCPDPARVMAKTLEVMIKIKSHYSLDTLAQSSKDITCFSIAKKDDFVVDSFPTGRLVCMVNERSGILEDHRRELAYFENADLNLPSVLGVKDIVTLMSRCRDVAIRFQASPALSSPVKMIVHDGTVAVSPNLDKYHPEVKLKPMKVNMKANAFSPDKLLRASKAIASFQADDVLSLESILESSIYPSMLLKSRKQANSICEANTVTCKQPACVTSIMNMPAKLKSILNENFGLLEFASSSSDFKAFCLFDTYDLYLNSTKTAAEGKVTLSSLLSAGEEVVFHGCEVLPRSCVPWLATAVWRPGPGLEQPPQPVPYQDISPDKLAVFEKVAETCSMILPSLEASAEQYSTQEGTSKKESAKDEDSFVKAEEHVQYAVIQPGSNGGIVDCRRVEGTEEANVLKTEHGPEVSKGALETISEEATEVLEDALLEAQDCPEATDNQVQLVHSKEKGDVPVELDFSQTTE